MFSAPLFEETMLSSLVFLIPLSNINQPCIRGLISGLLSLFCCSVCLSLCWNHNILITVALYYHLKSGNGMPPHLFFLRIALAISRVFFLFLYLWFLTNLRIVFSDSVKNTVGILIEIPLKL